MSKSTSPKISREQKKRVGKLENQGPYKQVQLLVNMLEELISETSVDMHLYEKAKELIEDLKLTKNPHLEPQLPLRTYRVASPREAARTKGIST